MPTGGKLCQPAPFGMISPVSTIRGQSKSPFRYHKKWDTPSNRGFVHERGLSLIEMNGGGFLRDRLRHVAQKCLDLPTDWQQGVGGDVTCMSALVLLVLLVKRNVKMAVILDTTPEISV